MFSLLCTNNSEYNADDCAIDTYSNCRGEVLTLALKTRVTQPGEHFMSRRHSYSGEFR